MKSISKIVVGASVLVIVGSVAILIIRCSSKNAKNGTSRHKLKHPEWYDSIDFPEDHFAPSKKGEIQYKKTVNDGYMIASSSTIVITGLARDIEKNIEINMDRLVKIGRLFKKYKIVIFENDSSDATRDIILRKSQTNNNISLVECKESMSCKLNQERAVESGILSTNRFQKMAMFRNRCLDHIKRYFSKYDYMMVVDLDLAGPISADGLVTCLTYQDWDAMSAVGMVNHPFTDSESLSYYDSIAFVPFGKTPQKEAHFNTLIHTIKTFQMKLPEREKIPVRVTSGFAGCSLYKLPRLINNPKIKYSGNFCEHVDFHMAMKNQGLDKIYVNPAFLLLHTITVSGKSNNLMEKVLFS